TEPVGMKATGARSSLPRRMTEPFPNCRSIWASAVSSAFSRSVADAIFCCSLGVVGDAPIGCRWHWPTGAARSTSVCDKALLAVSLTIPTVRRASDIQADRPADCAQLVFDYCCEGA